jgi:hypothetical protein
MGIVYYVCIDFPNILILLIGYGCTKTTIPPDSSLKLTADRYMTQIKFRYL